MKSDLISGFLAGQREQFLLWIPVFLGLGACVYFALPLEPVLAISFSIFLLAGGLAGGMTYALRRREEADSLYLAWLLAAALFWSATGLLAAHIQARAVHTPMLALDNKVADIEGRITSLEVQDGKRGYIVVLDAVRLDDWEEERTPRKIRLTIKSKTAGLSIGDRIRVLAKLHSASAPVMPDAFDFQRFYYFKGIGANGFSLKEPEVLARANERSPEFVLDHVRKAIAAKVSSILDERVSGIAVALMTGERAAISESDWSALRASGLAHIISISGLHVVLVAAPVFFIVRLLLAAIPFVALRWPIKKIAAAAALIVCCAYVAIVVPNVPTYRAMMMTGIGLIAIMLDRSPFSMRLVAFAACVVLLLSPDSIWSASFQMSFAAVVALVAAADVMRPYWSAYLRNGGWVRRVIVYTAGMVMTTFVASIATSPFSSFHFQQIASYSVVGNTLVTPLTGLIIMPMMVLSFLLMPFGLEQHALLAMGKGIQWMLDISQTVASWPGSMVHTPAWPQAALILMVAGGLALCLFAGKARLLCLPFFVVSLVLIGFSTEPRVIVGADGSVIMVNQKHVALVSSTKKEKFATEVWGRHINAETFESWPREGQRQDDGVEISCDGEACRITVPGLKISTGKSLYALKKDCDWADMIVVPEKKMKSCGKAVVYDRWKLRETGALAIMPDGRIKTVRQDQGERPWSTWPVPYAERSSGKSGSGKTVRPESAPGQE